jgi:hypothetical protein
MQYMGGAEHNIVTINTGKKQRKYLPTANRRPRKRHSEHDPYIFVQRHISDCIISPRFHRHYARILLTCSAFMQ